MLYELLLEYVLVPITSVVKRKFDLPSVKKDNFKYIMIHSYTKNCIKIYNKFPLFTTAYCII